MCLFNAQAQTICSKFEGFVWEYHGDNADISLENKRKLTSIVVFCHPCSCKGRILASLKVLRSEFT